MVGGYLEFEFDLPEALLSRLVQVFADMEYAVFAQDALEKIPEAQGVYQLFYGDDLVYIGKTDAEAGLRNRLQRHWKKSQHRVGLNPSQIAFKAVRIFVFTAMDLETQLITHYGGVPAVKWNGSGFGSNDPGRNRDTTRYKEDHFDTLFPIDISLPLDLKIPSQGTVASYLSMLKEALPYIFRFEGRSNRARRPHPDFENTIALFDEDFPITARSMIEKLVAVLPPGWQATKLPSHIILYKEKTHYPSGEVISSSPES